jgi:hypothetical protein
LKRRGWRLSPSLTGIVTACDRVRKVPSGILQGYARPEGYNQGAHDAT